MHINFVEVLNFRKLKSIRIDFARKTTVLVGANNSGKTSAMTALRLFLIRQSRFSITDFTLSNWSKLNTIGQYWETANPAPDFTGTLDASWDEILPTLDVWISARKDEIHYVSHLLPILKWEGGLIGVRFRLQPCDIEKLYKDYLISLNASKETLRSANALKRAGQNEAGEYSLKLWPSNMQDFLGHRGRLGMYFKVESYILDHAKLIDPVAGIASLQPLPAASVALEGNPFKGLIQIDAIAAQRGFSDLGETNTDEFSDEGRDVGETRRLSDQLKRYYLNHLDPSELPDATDIEALEGIHVAQQQFNRKLQTGFEKAFGELEGMGYPGLTDPKLRIMTKVEPLQGLNHSSSVQYDVLSPNEEGVTIAANLPEQSSGLGYQNLISIIFRLISFRDSWMQEGKAQKRRMAEVGEAKIHPPLHLVLVEEPEAHLHAQVQQVFIRKAYEVLRNHDQIRINSHFETQLVVSSHSSHIVHETDLAALRYFRRIPPINKGETPSSVVANLTSLFGAGTATQKFQTRYLRTTHADLFFADAVIMVEGAAERMLLPHFIREKFADSERSLYHRYISILEVGGSHAHRLQPLIKALGLPTLIITDLDSGKVEPPSNKPKSQQPEKGRGQITLNKTISTWCPGQLDVDSLLGLQANEKVLKIDDFSYLRVAYQTPIYVNFKQDVGNKIEVLAYTFEDSLALENLEVFEKLTGTGMAGAFSKAIRVSNDITELSSRLYKSIKSSQKGKFALDVLFEIDPEELKIPNYINEGLEWLQAELKAKDDRILVMPLNIKEAKDAVSTD